MLVRIAKNGNYRIVRSADATIFFAPSKTWRRVDYNQRISHIGVPASAAWPYRIWGADVHTI